MSKLHEEYEKVKNIDFRKYHRREKRNSVARADRKDVLVERDLIIAHFKNMHIKSLILFNSIFFFNS